MGSDVVGQVSQGEGVDVDCVVGGRPPARVSWWRGGLRASSGAGRTRLHISRAGREDAGRYVCRTDSSSCNTSITVFPPARLLVTQQWSLARPAG